MFWMRNKEKSFSIRTLISEYEKVILLPRRKSIGRRENEERVTVDGKTKHDTVAAKLKIERSDKLISLLQTREPFTCCGRITRNELQMKKDLNRCTV